MKITIEVPDETIESYLQSASSAISGWAEKYEYGRAKGSYIVKPHDDEETYRFGPAQIAAGLVVMAQDYPHHFADLMGRRGDMWTGHVLVQLAAFGELRYD